MTKCPCNGYTDRKLLCHSQCKRYQDWKNEYEAMKANKPDESLFTNEIRLRTFWANLRYNRQRWTNRNRNYD